MNLAQSLVSLPRTTRRVLILVVIAYPVNVWTQGVGMTMPVDATPSEGCSLDISSQNNPFKVPDSPSDLLPVDSYKLAPSAFLDDNPINFVSESCSTSWSSCPASGNINEQDGRINKFLRSYASSQDAKYILVGAVWTQLGVTPTGNPSISSCGGNYNTCATVLAQLAVTGRQAYNSFVSWDPTYAPVSGGPQAEDLAQLAQTGYPTTSAQLLSSNVKALPPLPSNFTTAQVQTAANAVLQQAYTALWAVRSNDPLWRQYRAGAGWIAVSGEDDTPHRPVNVPTAPFPQYDIAVPVTVNGRSYTLTTRYILASAKTDTFITTKYNERTCSTSTCAQLPVSTPAPPISTVTVPILNCIQPQPPLPQRSCVATRLTVPADSPKNVFGDLTSHGYIIYIHGGGSRLEEADMMAEQLLSQEGSLPLVVISFDLPNSAYADQWLRSTTGGAPVLLDAAALFEDNPSGNVYNYPILGFTMTFIANFIKALGQQDVIDPKQTIALMGGSLGGNMSLLLKMYGQPVDAGGFSSGKMAASPYNTNNPAVLQNMIPGSASIIAWSPTSMVSYKDQAGTIVGHNLSAGTTAVSGNNPAGWGPEFVELSSPGVPTTVLCRHNYCDTRSGYFLHLYYVDSANFPANLLPDPEMWYRNDWTQSTSAVNDCKAAFVAQSRYDRYEVYSSPMRRWTTALDTEQAIFSFQTNTDSTNKTYAPNYSFISGRTLIAAGACDDYDNESGAILPPVSTASTGMCANMGIGNTGANVATHQDIYGFTHDVASDMRNATGTTLFLNDTGHSIHDERPAFFAKQVINFLTQKDNNINLTFYTSDDDVRWNSEVHVLIGYHGIPSTNAPEVVGTLDIPLNYWFHPWPSGPGNLPLLTPLGSPNNPCGVNCTKLNTFDWEQNTIHNATIALPSGVNSTYTINSFKIEFVSGWDISSPGSPGYGNDKWDLAAIAACIPGTSGSFISDGFPNGGGTPTGTLHSFQAANFALPGVQWQPPSFQGTSTLASKNNNCNNGNFSPPPNSDVPGSVMSSAGSVTY
jgi:pimeloyl-ACP methyl ester carboxylesterase